MAALGTPGGHAGVLSPELGGNSTKSGSLPKHVVLKININQILTGSNAPIRKFGCYTPIRGGVAVVLINMAVFYFANQN